MRYLPHAFVSGLALVSLTACSDADLATSPQEAAEAAQVGSEDPCAGLDVQYIKEGILGPDASTRSRIQSSMDAEEYNRRYSSNEVKERLVCEAAKLIRGSVTDLKKSITNIALGFAKKAALAYLDGATGGLASAVFGGGGASPGPSIIDIQNAVRTVINEAFETERRAEFESHFQAFMQKYENLRALGRQPPEFGHLATIFNELHQPLSPLETQRYATRPSTSST
jgi:hypothetical protein